LWACLKDWGEDLVGILVEDNALDSLLVFLSLKGSLLSLDNSNWALELLLELITIDYKREGGMVLDCRWYLRGGG